jgi:flagellin-like hook-associated protein FlgL
VCRIDFERLSELRDFAIDLNSPKAYFRRDDDKFSNPQKRKFFLDIEHDLQALDFEAWEFLKNETLPRLKAKHPARGWHQLFETLNEAKGYIHLTSIGCTNVKFIPRSKTDNVQTPDLQGQMESTTVLCEVKTINVSEVETERRHSGGVGTTLAHLEESFFKKLMSTIDSAASQLRAFGADVGTRRIVLVVINFDDSLHEYADSYESQINDRMTKVSMPGIEVAFDIKPPFYSAI